MARQSLIEFFGELIRHGEDTAIAHRRGYRMERWTYRRLAEAARQFARELEARGIGKGDAVLLWAGNSPEWVMAFWGCVLRGAVVVPIDVISTRKFSTNVAQRVNASLILRSRAIAAPENGVPSLVLESLAEICGPYSSVPYDSQSLSRQDILEIIFTSGTTAEPRGVAISHGNILANVETLEGEIRKYLRYERPFHPLRFLNVVPLSHIFGQLMGMFVPPILGATTIFMDSLNPAELMETMRRERVSVLVAVPRMIEALGREIERQEESKGRLQKFRINFAAAEKEHFLKRCWRFRSVHRRLGWKFWAMISGGASLPGPAESLWSRMGFAVIQGYGLTETASLISVNNPFRPGKGSIGKLLPGIEMKIDVTGEILVRGENVAAGYWQGPRLQSVAGQDGWFHTGDLAERDAQGLLFFKGRQKNVIVTPAGMNVYPEDLEAALRKQKGVKDCVVFGWEQDGNAEPCAALLLDDPNTDVEAIMMRANNTLAEFQRIRRWVVWPDLDFPRTPTQKPLLPRIREVVEAKLSGKAAAEGGGRIAELVARITGRPMNSMSPKAELEGDLKMSSLDRVELMSALEEQYQIDLRETEFSDVTTMKQLEDLVRKPVPAAARAYPEWGQSRLITALRLVVYYLLVWPATYLLAAPKVNGRKNLDGLSGPVLVVCNHVTDVDIGWILAALPARFRHRLATAMGGEKLATMRRPPKSMNALQRMRERMDYFLVIALFNVFPLPKESGFRKSFSFAGHLADKRWSILIFPEGMTTLDGRLQPFRSGAGLLAQQLNIPVVPMRLDGPFDLKRRKKILALPKKVTVAIGVPMRFAPETDVADITRELENRVAELTPEKS